MPRYHLRGDLGTDMDLHSPEKVAVAFCQLAGVVNEKLFRWSVASDCFCEIGDEHPKMLNFQWDRQMWEFIADAVMGAVRTEAEIHERIRVAVAEAKEELEHEIAMMRLRDLP